MFLHTIIDIIIKHGSIHCLQRRFSLTKSRRQSSRPIAAIGSTGLYDTGCRKSKGLSRALKLFRLISLPALSENLEIWFLIFNRSTYVEFIAQVLEGWNEAVPGGSRLYLSEAVPKRWTEIQETYRRMRRKSSPLTLASARRHRVSPHFIRRINEVVSPTRFISLAPWSMNV